MKVEKGKLVKVQYVSKALKKTFCLEDIKGILLENLHLYDMKTKEEVPFVIFRNHGRMYICPKENNEESSYYFVCNQVKKADVISIEAGDCIDIANKDGCCKISLLHGVIDKMLNQLEES